MLLVNNTAPLGKAAPSLTANGKTVVLLSPMEVQTDILRLSPAARKQRGAAIRRELRSRYPGNADTADVDYFPLPRVRETPARLRPLAVFTTEKETGLRYREKQKPVIPGLAVLLAGRKFAGGNSDMVLLVTPDWIEAALFMGEEPVEYFALAVRRENADTPSPLPLSLSLIDLLEKSQAKTGTKQQGPTLIILKDTEKTDKRVLDITMRYTEHRIISIDRFFGRINIRKHAVFRRQKTKTAFLNKRAAVFLAALYGLSILITLALVTVKAENAASLLERTWNERKALHDENDRLLAEVKAIGNPDPASGAALDGAGISDPYTIIAEIHRRVRGAAIHSLTIQGDKFSFEAEAPDALRLLRELEQSDRLTGITLNQTAPLSADREQFSVSGRMRYE